MSRANHWFRELLAVLLVVIGIIFVLNNFNPGAHITSIIMPIIFLSVGCFVLVEHFSDHKQSTNWFSAFIGYLLCLIALLQILELVLFLNFGIFASVKFLLILDIALFLTLISFRQRFIVLLTSLILFITVIDILSIIGYWKYILPLILVVFGTYLFIKIPHKEL